MKRSQIRADPEKTLDWQRRSAARAAENAAMRPKTPLKRAKRLSGAQGARSGAKRKRTREATCAGCGETFESVPTHLGWTQYCSHRCAGEAKRKPIERRCPSCREMFTTTPSGPKTCSTQCANVARSVGKRGAANPRYLGEKGRRARWKASKASCCVRCGTERRLQLHHVVYEQEIRRLDGDVYDPRASLTLCIECHVQHHKALRHTIPLVLLRDENYEFAFELLGAAAFDYLTRRYAGKDPRLRKWLRRTEAAAASSGEFTGRSSA